jgi:hypothetical protein
MVWFDIFYSVCLTIALFFNKALIVDIAETIRTNQAGKPIINQLDDSVPLFLVCTEAVTLILTYVKVALGIRYVILLSFPPKKDYDYLYRGKIGHNMWRVVRVKRMRSYLG